MQSSLLSPQLLITDAKQSIPLHLVTVAEYALWLATQPDAVRNWLTATHFHVKCGQHSLMQTMDGSLDGVVAIIDNEPNIWSIAQLPASLPPHHYHLQTSLTASIVAPMVLGWLLACYRFTAFKADPETKPLPSLVCPAGLDAKTILAQAESLCFARELINLPANVMGPDGLAEAALKWAARYHAVAEEILGDSLLKEHYPLIFTVGQASAEAPRLVDIRLSKPGAPKVTLVGKGVCFDTGGLDIKSSGNMKLMKKDMGGAACVLALADLLVQSNLNIDLRIMLPIVENSVSAAAMRPSDVVRSRKGLTVEIGNTDAEGRLILCDALSEADSEKPDLLIDFATLTGAARIALGTDIPAFFTHHDALATNLANASKAVHDPLWRLPLWAGYREMISSTAADINNEAESGYGGAITAALFLNEFVSTTTAWLHIDLMAWNLKTRPGRPAGGEAMAVRAVHHMIMEMYGGK